MEDQPDVPLLRDERQDPAGHQRVEGDWVGTGTGNLQEINVIDFTFEVIHAADEIIAGYEETQRLLPLAGGIPRPIEESTDHAVVLARFVRKIAEESPPYKATP